MLEETVTYGTTRVLHLAEDGAPISSEEQGRDLLEAGMADQVDWIAVPVGRLDDTFFTLSTGLAGALTQRLQNYGFGLAVVGDIGERIAASESLRALVAEADRRGARGSLLFAADAAELEQRLTAA